MYLLHMRTKKVMWICDNQNTCFQVRSMLIKAFCIYHLIELTFSKKYFTQYALRLK